MYYGHPKFLTLEQGEFVLERKLKDLDFVVSPSQPETPRDGSCLFHALLDQCSYIPDLRDVASNHQELRFRIINYGYDFYLKTGKVNWAGQSETPVQWKKSMSGSGEWGDEVCLNLACNVLGVNIVIAVAFQDSNLIIRSLDKPKHELFPNLSISLTKEKLDNEKARMDNLTPSTSMYY